MGDQEPPKPPLIEVVLQSEMPLDLSKSALALPSVVIWNLEKQQSETLALIRPKRFEMPGQNDAPAANPPSLADLGLTDAPQLVKNPALPAPSGLFSPDGELWQALDMVGDLPCWAAMEPLAPRGGRVAMLRRWCSRRLCNRALWVNCSDRAGGASLGGSAENQPFRTGAADGPDAGGWGQGRLTPVPRKYQGIILVSNSLSTLPEAVGVLTGNPVYTVYVEVPDAPRKWILQFCVPQTGGASLEFSGEVVQVLNRKTMNPPFAVRKEPFKIDLIPTIERLAELPSRVVAYATVDAEGNLHNLRIIRGADPSTDDRILASLKNWEFVPAFRDGQPIEVEALFGIPLY